MTPISAARARNSPTSSRVTFGDAAHLTLPPQLLVVEGRDVVEVDRVDGDDATAIEVAEREHDDVAHGREGDRRVERHGRRRVEATDPTRAEASARRCCSDSDRVTTYTSQPQCTATWITAVAEAPNPYKADAHAGSNASDLERPIADHASTQERRDVEIVEAIGQREHEVGAGNGRGWRSRRRGPSP